MKKIFDRIHSVLDWGFSTEPASSSQRGFWVDRVEKGNVCIGLGGRVMRIRRHSTPQIPRWLQRLVKVARHGVMGGLVYDLDIRLPCTSRTLALLPAAKSERGFWIDRRNGGCILVGLGRSVLYVERLEARTPWVALAR